MLARKRLDVVPGRFSRIAPDRDSVVPLGSVEIEGKGFRGSCRPSIPGRLPVIRIDHQECGIGMYTPAKLDVQLPFPQEETLC